MSGATCQFCGAQAYREAYKPGFSPPKKWLCGTVGDMRSSACYEAEIEQLRSKLTPEGAEPLRWTWVKYLVEAVAKGAGVNFKMMQGSHGIELWMDSDLEMCGFDDFEEAKAHAEELHQAAWREFIEKWGRK